MPMSPARARGFTLVEMAVVVLIVGLLLGGLLANLTAMHSSQNEAQTRRQLEDIREALIVFAVVNRRLPCPAAPATADTVVGAGLEQPPIAGGCTGGLSGVLPWATLGLPQTDPWARRFTYRVTAAFARTAPAITLASVGDITVQNRSLVTIAAQVPVVVVSHGQDGAGSRNRSGAVTAAGSDSGQVQNANNDAIFVSDTPTETFDDQIIWVPTTLLLGRMLQGGVLP
jgi:prepilin-type N-terminal cleavage/methylation domain-containing protein